MMKYIPIDQKQAIIDIVNSSENDPTKLQADKDALTPGSAGPTSPARHGTAVRSNQAQASGINGPLTEDISVDREYFEEEAIVDSSGTSVYAYKQVQSITFLDSSEPPQSIKFIFQKRSLS